MSIINTDKTVSLRSLICSGQIGEKTHITIYDEAGSFICRGRWYEDKVLEYGECFGKASKAGTGCSIAFRLARPQRIN